MEATLNKKRGVATKPAGSTRSPKDALPTAMLELASSGDLIRTIKGRGYRVFPEIRCEETEVGWFIAKTDWEYARSKEKQT